ncbi:MAG: hypothetical protein J5809_04415 [Selenomonadaceae bacterium]|nr:hypothetical protein [Selenomonadaceae bacterium]
MKKILSVMLAVLVLSAATVCAAAGSYDRSNKVVIIGGAEFKTNDYYKIVRKNFGKKTNAKFEAGSDVQESYQVFMMERYDIGENKPHKQDLIDFAAESGYGNVLFLIVDEHIDTQNNASSRQKNRITVQVDAYLVNSSRIVDVATTSQDFISKTSNLRARRGAFEKCVKEVASKMNL